MWNWIFYFPVLYVSIFLLLVFLENNEKNSKVNKTLPSVSIIIPAYNEEKTISSCIESTLSLDYPANKFEVIVVNDGSKDKTKEIAEKYDERGEIKLINQENKGKGAALNAGLSIAKGELIACQDADSFVSGEALKRIVKKMDAKTACVTPAMKVYKPENVLEKVQWLEYLLGIFLRKIMEFIDCIYVAPGPFSVYRKEVVKELGGFDNESLVEDMEMAYRLQKNQWKIRHSSEADVFTKAPQNLKSFYKQRNRWYKGSILNIVKYKEMLFNPDYGDFGFFQMPVNLIQGLFSIVAVVLLLNYFFLPIFLFIKKISLVGLDYFSNLSMSFSYLNLQGLLLGFDYKSYSIIGFLVGLTMIMLILSHKYSREKVGGMKDISLILYIFGFFLAIGVIWILVLVELVVGRERRW